AALRKRGWVERKHTVKGDIPDHKEEGNDAERIANSNDIHDIMSRLVRNEETTFYWTIKKDAVDYYNLHIDQMLNHYARTGSFTTKIGLCLHMRNLPWYVSANPNAFFPRCYGICMDDEKLDFIDDFRKTAASSIIKWVVNLRTSGDTCNRLSKENADKEDETSTKDSDDKKAKELPERLVEMACKVCETYLAQSEHSDIDSEAETTPVLSDREWNQLIEQYYSLVHEGAVICNAENYFTQCQNILRRIISVNPQRDIDGLHNIWIIKPGAKSRGRGRNIITLW
uniref:Uncharacterized protein n=1 Tax=Podarcis muralis TaxID=64176 RepID=A0A670JAL6_PODMU